MNSKSDYDNMVFAKNLNRLISQSEVTQSDIARLLGVSKSTVSSWCSGQKTPRMGKVQTLADYFGVMKSDLIEDRENENFFLRIKNPEDILPIKKQRIPLLGEIACGIPIFADENFESYVEAGAEIRCDFALRAKGDSMINARICDGDIVFIRKQPTVDNGEIAAVLIEDEATLKRVYYDKKGKKILLGAENSKYPPLVYTGEELERITILGKAVAFQSDIS